MSSFLVNHLNDKDIFLKLTRKIKKVGEALQSLVQQEYKHAIQIEVREEPAPFGISAITAANPKAHPGTGIRRVLMDDEGNTYGIHGEKDLGELIRLKGLKDDADPKQFLRLINLAYFEGIALLVNPEPRFIKTPKGWSFQFFRNIHPSGKRVATVFQLTASGAAQLTEI